VTLIASHADVDHIQGFAKAKQTLKTTVTSHPLAAEPLESGDKLATYAEIAAQDIHLDMPQVKVENRVEDGDRIHVGSLELEVWHTPGHTNGQLSFRLGNLLFSGDNLFRDGCVGAIDAHHGSSIQDFIKSLQRIRASNVEWLLPSHGPVFRKDDRLIDSTIARLETYLHMADFGTCAIDWPLMDQWERELVEGKMPE
jgi:glyoxylase-like metal-dependent hydrolase (beta-lactamase superfamily II)